ncbi:hypothetical protein [Bradyrhizobium sp. WSM1417]|uniref:hypothetical protein n=1 Tax=Bradyrhizobium sp. WSM1417 TaxID=754500 RepID=UPI0012ECA7F4|nr:hypothetical protein [Bradyrhizobium sp. WSM1417]
MRMSFGSRPTGLLGSYLVPSVSQTVGNLVEQARALNPGMPPGAQEDRAAVMTNPSDKALVQPDGESFKEVAPLTGQEQDDDAGVKVQERAGAQQPVQRRPALTMLRGREPAPKFMLLRTDNEPKLKIANKKLLGRLSKADFCGSSPRLICR